MSYNLGGGGGTSGADTTDQSTHDLPFELGSTYNADELNELLRILFKSLTRIEADTGAGDVTGPANAADDSVAVFDGTTGKIIKDSGIDIADLALAAGTIQVAEVSLTESQLEALNTTTIQLIPAPGAGKIAVPVQCTVKVVLTTTYGSDPTFSLVFDGNTNSLIDGMTLGLTADTGTKYRAAGPTTWTTAAAFDPLNKAVHCRFSANPTSPGVGVVTAVVSAGYYIIEP